MVIMAITKEYTDQSWSAWSFRIDHRENSYNTECLSQQIAMLLIWMLNQLNLQVFKNFNLVEQLTKNGKSSNPLELESPATNLVIHSVGSHGGASTMELGPGRRSKYFQAGARREMCGWWMADWSMMDGRWMAWVTNQMDDGWWFE